MRDDPDLSLVQQAQAGNQAAFSTLFRKYYNMVYAVAYGVLNRREESQDVTQDVLIKVHRDIQKFKGDSKFKTWLYRVTVNAAIDSVRRRKEAEPIENVGDFLASNTIDPRRAASQAELKVRMQEALQKVSAEHRAVLVLREWENLSYEEIAETLQLESGTVMSRIFYARKALAKVLGIEYQEAEIK